MSPETIFKLVTHNPAIWNDTFYVLYLDGYITSEECDFWTASPTRWNVSRNFYIY